MFKSYENLIHATLFWQCIFALSVCVYYYLYGGLQPRQKANEPSSKVDVYELNRLTCGKKEN